MTTCSEKCCSPGSFNGWAETDPQAALAALETVPARRRETLRHEITKSWAQFAPEEVMAWVADIGDESARKQLYGALSSTLAKENPQLAIEALLASDQPSRGETLFRTFAKEDWEGTMATLGDWEDPELRAQAAKSMLSHAHWNGLQLGDDEKPLLDWLADSPSALADARSGRRQDYVEIISDEGLAELSENDPETYAALLPSIIRSRTDADPAGAVGLVDQLDEAMLSQGGERLRQEAVSVWARQEPQAAAEWAEALPEGTARDYAFLNLTAAWASYDPGAALGWLEALPATGARDFAAQAFAESTAGRDSDSALAAAGMIADREKRNEILKSVWEQRLATGVETARVEMEKADLPPSVRDRLEAKANQVEAWHALGRSEEAISH